MNVYAWCGKSIFFFKLQMCYYNLSLISYFPLSYIRNTNFMYLFTSVLFYSQVLLCMFVCVLVNVYTGLCGGRQLWVTFSGIDFLLWGSISPGPWIHQVGWMDWPVSPGYPPDSASLALEYKYAPLTWHFHLSWSFYSTNIYFCACTMLHLYQLLIPLYPIPSSFFKKSIFFHIVLSSIAF